MATVTTPCGVARIVLFDFLMRGGKGMLDRNFFDSGRIGQERRDRDGNRISSHTVMSPDGWASKATWTSLRGSENRRRCAPADSGGAR